MNFSLKIDQQFLHVLLKPLGVHKGEEAPVLLLLGNGFFMGIFIATYYTGANTLFLNSFDDSYLSKAFIASGILGVLSTYLFSRFQSIVSFSTLIVVNLVVIAIAICGLRIGYEFTDSKWLIFLIFILNVPLSALALLGFWGVVARLFNLRQAKRIIGSIDTGQLSAIILSFYATPILTRYIPETINFFIISAVSIIISLGFLIAIVARFKLNTLYEKDKKREIRLKIKFKVLIKNEYVRLISLFLIFSMVAYVFVDYSFLSVTKVKYPDEVDLANFLGVFNGTIMIMSFLMQTFVNEKLIAMYGLKTSLLVLPVLLGILTLISALVGTFLGYSLETGTFLFFFLFITLSKLFNTSLRESLENPTIKLFFLPLDGITRFDIQTKVEGVINQFSVLIAGGIIFLLGLFHFFKIIHYSYFLLIIIAGWIYVTGKIYLEYKNTLKEKLEEQKRNLNITIKKEVNSLKLLQAKFSSTNFRSILCSLKILEKLEPSLLETSLVQLVKNPSVDVRKYALEEINALKCVHALNDVSEQAEIEESPEVKTLALKAMESLKEADRVSLSKFQFFILVKSSNYDDRKIAARLLGKVDDEEYSTFLLELLRDIHPEVRIAAIISAGRVKRAEFYSLLIDNLASHVYETTAVSALVEIGEPILPILEEKFYKSGHQDHFLENIIKVYGKIGSEICKEYLWKKVDYPNKKIVNASLYALSRCNFKAKDYQVVIIIQFIERNIRNIAWNLAALAEIPKGYIDEKRILRNALRDENKSNYNHIYMLLTMLYDEKSIQLVKENIESRTGEGVTFAIELLDVFLDDDIKPYLLIVLDDLQPEEKLNRLEDYFPRESHDSESVLLQIINRDYNALNIWTKACAIYTYGKIPGVKICDDLIANLFNNEWLLKESAAYVIFKIDVALYHKHSIRLGTKDKAALDEALMPEFNVLDLSIPKLKIEKILFLKSLSSLKDTKASLLNKLLDFTELLTYDINHEINLSLEDNQNYIYLIHTGSANIFKNRHFIATLNEKDIFGDLLFFNSDIKEYVIVIAEEAIMFRIDKYRFYNLMGNNVRITQNVVTYMSSFINEEQLI